MDNIIKNYEEVLYKPPSTRLFLKFLKHKIYANIKHKKNIKKFQPQEDHVHNEPPAGIEVVSFAILIDNVVIDIMHVQKEFGSILEKNPTFIPIDKNKQVVHPGFIYKDGSFISVLDASSKASVTMRA